MPTAPIGTWWRTSKLLPATEVLRGVTSAATRWIFVGYDTGAPKIYTVENADFDVDPSTFTARTPNGPDPLYGTDYISGEDIAVAVGDNGRIETSSNKGDSWSSLTVATATDFRDVVGLTGSTTANMVAVGDGAIWGRNDVGSWSSRWLGSNFWQSVAYKSGSGWVAVGTDGWVTQSPTAASLSFITPYRFDTATLWCVAANASYFIAGGAGGKLWRSATGLSGTWAALTIDTTASIAAIAKLTTDNNWALIAFSGKSFTSTDNGLTWVANDAFIADNIWSMQAGLVRAGAVGTNGGIHYSASQTQEDPVAVAPPTSAPAFSANADMSGDAVRRLVTQFRSGRG